MNRFRRFLGLIMDVMLPTWERGDALQVIVPMSAPAASQSVVRDGQLLRSSSIMASSASMTSWRGTLPLRNFNFRLKALLSGR